jgi:hypothetical protein
MTDSPTEDRGPLITAQLVDGPLSGTRVAVGAVEGRPPKTVDAEGPDGARHRYCLDEWEQSGHSAQYSFLYDV